MEIYILRRRRKIIYVHLVIKVTLVRDRLEAGEREMGVISECRVQRQYNGSATVVHWHG